MRAMVDRCGEAGMDLLDCWMSEPEVRSNLGAALHGRRSRWIVQGHIGSTWQGGQYVRSREPARVREAFADLLARFRTDYMDLGMLHFVDALSDFDEVMNGEVFRFAAELRRTGAVRQVGLSTHNPEVALRAAESGEIAVILFSVNPAFDLLPPSDDLEVQFGEAAYADPALGGIDPTRASLYRTCERSGVAITVMKGYAGGRLLAAEASPFGAALTPVQCLHYALTRPAVASVLVGFSTAAHVEAAAAYATATEAEKDYASVLAAAPRHRYAGQCTYCGHCSPCPAAIDIPTVLKLDDLAEMQAEAPPTVRAHYRALPASAADCVACGDCEARCPFGVPVVERMRAAAARFG